MVEFYANVFNVTFGVAYLNITNTPFTNNLNKASDKNDMSINFQRGGLVDNMLW